jgi:hypothetical protein
MLNIQFSGGNFCCSFFIKVLVKNLVKKTFERADKKYERLSSIQSLKDIINFRPSDFDFDWVLKFLLFFY